MITMKDLGRIRRLFYRDGMSLSEISRKTGFSLSSSGSVPIIKEYLGMQKRRRDMPTEKSHYERYCKPRN